MNRYHVTLRQKMASIGYAEEEVLQTLDSKKLDWNKSNLDYNYDKVLPRRQDLLGLS